MAATDIKPSRIEAAKAAAEAFVDRQPSAVRIGVVAFGNGAVIVQTPTLAHAEVLTAIDRLSLGGGTSVGQGMLTSLDAIAGKPLTINQAALGQRRGKVNIGYYGWARIVLFSDGEDDERARSGGDGPGRVGRGRARPDHRHRHGRRHDGADQRIHAWPPPWTATCCKRWPP